jgi:hypothetical protein
MALVMEKQLNCAIIILQQGVQADKLGVDFLIKRQAAPQSTEVTYVLGSYIADGGR